MPLQNHVVDPTYFYDAIEEFAFDYDCFIVTNKIINQYGEESSVYTRKVIRGSLQSNGTTINRSTNGNTQNKSYKFYCKSLYRINIGDVIGYKNNYMIVTSVHDYDEWGVRECECNMIKLTAYKDLAEYIKYLNGDIIV